jgi:hypothetical protein
MIMTSSLRGSSIRADFEDVLKTVGRGLGSRSGEEFAPGEPDIGSTTHSSFEFLRALDSVSDQHSTPASPVADDLSSFYAETDFEAEPEAGYAEPAGGIGAEDLGERYRHDAEPGHSAAAPDGAGANETPTPEEVTCDLPTTCDPDSLVAELGLKSGMTRSELRRLRRRFALENHPDRLAPSRREIASRRMTIANSLIDAALRRAGGT